MAIMGRVFQLQYVEGDYWKQRSDSLTLAYKTIEPSRGNIFSADGSLLATSVPLYDLRMDMKAESITDKIFNAGIDSLALNLAALFQDKTKDQYKRMLREGRRDGERYLLIKRNVSYAELKKVKTFPIFNKGRYKGGLIVEQKICVRNHSRNLLPEQLVLKLAMFNLLVLKVHSTIVLEEKVASD